MILSSWTFLVLVSPSTDTALTFCLIHLTSESCQDWVSIDFFISFMISGTFLFLCILSSAFYCSVDTAHDLSETLNPCPLRKAGLFRPAAQWPAQPGPHVSFVTVAAEGPQGIPSPEDRSTVSVELGLSCGLCVKAGLGGLPVGVALISGRAFVL